MRKLNKDTTVIFLSSYEWLVFESFKVDTFRFLVKPLDEEMLFEAMDAFIDSLASEAILTIRIAGENCLYPEKNITYVEGTGKNSILHFTDKPDEVMCSETLSAMEEKLSKRRFFRCHKSFLVNLGRVYSYNREGIKMSDGDSIMVSRSKYKEFGIALTEYLSSKRGL